MTLEEFKLVGGVIDARQLDDGRVVALVPLTFGRVRLTVGTGFCTYDDSW